MKKRIRNLLFCTIIVCSLLYPAQFFAEEGLAIHQSLPDFKNIPVKFAKMEKDQVPVRKGPDFNSETIERLKPGVHLQIIMDEGGFYQVWLPQLSQLGYVSKNDVFVLDPSHDDTILFHQVMAGDTIWKIADMYKTSLKALLEINHLSPNGDLIVGQSLIIPKGSPDGTAINTDKIPPGFGPVNKTMKKYSPVDLYKNHWAYTQLDDFLNADILSGIENHGAIILNPDKLITRAEFVTIVTRALGQDHIELTNSKSFTDVQPDDWFYRYIQIASAKGIVHGIDEKHFAPNQFIRRDEIAAIVVRAFEETIDSNGTSISFIDVSDYWAKPFIEKASSLGIITGYGDNSFKPGRYATRAEAVSMLYRALQKENSDLPTEHELIEHVTHELSEIDWYIRDRSYTYQDLNHFIENNITGYYKAYLLQQVKNYKALHTEKNIFPVTTLRGPRTVQVIHRSNRFATVEIQGANYDVTLKGGNDLLVKGGFDRYRNFSLDSSGILLLKKMPDGTWKSYMFFPKKSDSYHFIEGIVKRTKAIIEKILKSSSPIVP